MAHYWLYHVILILHIGDKGRPLSLKRSESYTTTKEGYRKRNVMELRQMSHEQVTTPTYTDTLL